MYSTRLKINWQKWYRILSMKISTKNNYLYILLHIPKTAGTTLGAHIKNNFLKDEVLLLYFTQPYFNVITQREEFFESQDDIDLYLRSLSLKQKNKLKVIYGHEVYYGIDRHFEKSARYLTILRDPLERTYSAYNFCKKLFKTAPTNELWNRSLLYRQSWSWMKETMSTQGTFVSFEDWVVHPSQANYIFEYLKQRNFIPQSESSKPSTFLGALDKFYFVGILENFKKDSMFIYHLLHIQSFYPNQNVSDTSLYSLGINIMTSFQKMNELDGLLYEEALSHNKIFKKETLSFIVNVMLTRYRKLVFFFMNTPSSCIHFIYKTSSKMKTYSRLYTRTIQFIKNINKEYG